jgi:hypothetical protein
VLTEEMNKKVITQLYDREAMVRLISKGGNLSAPRLEGITFLFFKLEKGSADRIIIAMMKFIIFQHKIPDIWKIGKAILKHKAGDDNNPKNSASITLT